MVSVPSGALDCLWTGIRTEIQHTMQVENQTLFELYVKRIDQAVAFYREHEICEMDSLEREYAELKDLERKRATALISSAAASGM
jgi:hypothetical protein